jgi:hypothetical protein
VTAAERYWPLPEGVGREMEMRGYVVVRKADLRHFLDVWIDNGMTENEDVAVIERLWAAVQ